MYQQYENKKENPLEVLFMMPHSTTFTLSHIEIDFVLPDGSIKKMSTRVIEREVAEKKYEDKVAAGESAVLATFAK